MTLTGRLWRLLRSRRLAVWLLLGMAAYSLLATLVPQTSTAEEEVAPWAAAHPLAESVVRVLGMHHAYTTPLFLVLAALLTTSTAACAWERSRAAIRVARSARGVSKASVERLRTRPSLVLTPHADDPLQAVERELWRLRMRVRRGPVLVQATGGSWALLGSPAFHWALAALFVVVAVGQLTRAEGMIGIPVGGSRIDEPSAYGKVSSGPLHPGHTGVRIAVEDFTLHYKATDGFDYGASPRIAVYDGDRLLKRQWVHPNAPLRQGRLLLHADDYGLASWITLLEPGGATAASTQYVHDFDTSSRSGTTPARFTFQIDGREMTAEIAPLAESVSRGGVRYLVHSVPETQQLRVSLRGVSPSADSTLTSGGALGLPGGYKLRFDRITYYARVSVADDASVPPIYALFAIACVALAIAVFVPFRSVRVLLAEDGRALYAEWRHSRHDAAFEERVIGALKNAGDVRERSAETPSAEESA